MENQRTLIRGNVMQVSVRQSKWFPVAALLIVGVHPLTAIAARLPSAAATAPNIREAAVKLAALQVPFIPNAGQWGQKAAFAAHTFAAPFLSPPAARCCIACQVSPSKTPPTSPTHAKKAFHEPADGFSPKPSLAQTKSPSA